MFLLIIIIKGHLCVPLKIAKYSVYQKLSTQNQNCVAKHFLGVIIFGQRFAVRKKKKKLKHSFWLVKRDNKVSVNSAKHLWDTLLPS